MIECGKEYHNKRVVDIELSGGVLAASANNVIKYTTRITLSVANPTPKTEGEISEVMTT